MATLYYVPMVHAEELLQRAPKVLRHFEGRPEAELAKSAFSEIRAQNTRYWDGVREELPTAHIDKVYCDSATCGDERATGWLSQWLDAKEVNLYYVVGELLAGGARMMKTERVRNLSYPVRVRDDYVSKRINRTLRGGETGVLFMGSAHRYPGFNGRLKLVRRRRAFDRESDRNYELMLERFGKENGMSVDETRTLNDSLRSYVKSMMREEAEAKHGKGAIIY